MSTTPAAAAPELQRLLAHHHADPPRPCLQILREWQGLQGWLAPEALSQVASALA